MARVSRNPAVPRRKHHSRARALRALARSGYASRSASNGTGTSSVPSGARAREPRSRTPAISASGPECARTAHLRSASSEDGPGSPTTNRFQGNRLSRRRARRAARSPTSRTSRPAQGRVRSSAPAIASTVSSPVGGTDETAPLPSFRGACHSDVRARSSRAVSPSATA